MTRYHDQMPAEHDPDYAAAVFAFESCVLDLMNMGCHPETVIDRTRDAIRMAEGLEDEDR